MRLVGAQSGASMKALVPLPSRSHYLIGNDPKRWRSNVAHYGRVEVESVYPGVNVVYYGNQRQLEYDFVVTPGADPRVIRLAFEGADAIEIDRHGDLVLRLAGGEVRQRPPLVYQEIDGNRREVRGRYALDEQGHVRFQLAAYEPTVALVIDPTLAYSTYLGGSGIDFASDIAVDAAGNAYVTGMTASSDFPVQSAAQPGFGGVGVVWGDAFVAKFDAAGSLVYSTYLGGSAADFGHRIAVDGSGHAYVAGLTDSTDFPTANALQPAHAGGLSDGFVTKLAPDGSALVYSTYLGGSFPDSASGIAVDATGHAYVSGDTHSSDFPTTPGTVKPFRSFFPFNSDVFVTKLNPAGSARVYSTYLGSTDDEASFRLAIDPSGNAYVTGFTESATNFATAGAFQTTFGGGTDCFVIKLNPDASARVYATYLGGIGFDHCAAIAADASGHAYVGGRTVSPDFPTANALQGTAPGGEDGFVAKLNPTGSALVYSTYLGGTGNDIVEGVALDADGNVYVTGTTSSDDFPTADASQSALGGGAGDEDAFVAKIAASGAALVYSTYLGGALLDFGKGIAVDGNRDAYVAGGTISTDFPTENAAQPNLAGETDAFVAKFGTPLFPGQGQRPRDVSMFLQYASPQDARTQLPSGTTSFDVRIFYGATIDATTFRATLNGAAFAGFTPAAGSNETVTVPLVPGRNVLRLEVQGVRTDGRTGTDQDALTFIVQ